MRRAVRRVFAARMGVGVSSRAALCAELHALELADSYAGWEAVAYRW